MNRYRMLGPLAVERDGRAVDLGPPKQRAVLAALLHADGRAVSTDRLIDQVWGDTPPASVQASVQVHISRLRSALRTDVNAPSPITRSGGAYLLDTGRDVLDVAEFAGHATAATDAVERSEWSTAVDRARAGLSLWRGEYLADLADEPWVQVAAVPLTDRRRGMAADLVVGLLGSGDVAGAVAQATDLAAQDPLDERAAWLRIVALHRAGRVSDALDAFRDVTGRLDRHLGLDPGPALVDLQTSILRHDGRFLTWPAGANTSAPPEVAATVAEPAAAPPAEGTALVGRDDELATLTRSLDPARSGPRWIVLGGPAGIGKSRLAAETAARWTDTTRGLAAWAWCPDVDERPAWWPVRQLLRDLGEDPDILLTRNATDAVDVVGHAVLDRVVGAVRRHAAARPLLLVVDDLHWADQSSLRLLGLLAETATEPGLAVVLTTRPSGDAPDLDRLLDVVARRPGSRRLSLGPLDETAVGSLVEAVSGERPTAGQATELTSRTGGSPFAVVEFARLPEGQRFGRHTPDAVRTALRRRFAALPEPLHETARVAAVLGEPLDVRLLAAVLGDGVSVVTDRLDDAADADLLSPAADGGSYVFSHALLRDELAAEVGDGRRQSWHARAAAALAATAPVDELRRARHLLAAGHRADPLTAGAAFRAAAAAAEDGGRAAEAAGWWAAAVGAHDRLSPGDGDDEREAMIVAHARALARAGQGQALLDVLDAALTTAWRAGRTASVGRLAATLLRVSGSWPWPVYGSDPAAIMTTLHGLEGALDERGDLAARARVLAVTAIGHCYDPDPDVPDRLSARAITLAEDTDDADVVADALLGRALTYAGVASHAHESVALLERLRALPHEQTGVDRVLADNIATMATIDLGRVDDSARQMQAAALGADALRMPVSRVQVRWHEAALAQWHGDLRRASDLYARADEAHRGTDLQQSGTRELTLVVRAFDRGLLAEAPASVPTNPFVSRWLEVVVAAAAGRPGCDEALAREVATPEPDVWTSHGRLTLLAHVVADRGLTGLARPLLDAIRPVADQLAAFGQCGVVGPVGLAAARLAHLLGDTATADAHLATAVDLAVSARGPLAHLMCRIERAIWTVESPESDPASVATLLALADDADRAGMPGHAARARSRTRRRG